MSNSRASTVFQIPCWLANEGFGLNSVFLFINNVACQIVLIVFSYLSLFWSPSIFIPILVICLLHIVGGVQFRHEFQMNDACNIHNNVNKTFTAYIVVALFFLFGPLFPLYYHVHKLTPSGANDFLVGQYPDEILRDEGKYSINDLRRRFDRLQHLMYQTQPMNLIYVVCFSVLFLLYSDDVFTLMVCCLIPFLDYSKTLIWSVNTHMMSIKIIILFLEKLSTFTILFHVIIYADFIMILWFVDLGVTLLCIIIYEGIVGVGWYTSVCEMAYEGDGCFLWHLLFLVMQFLCFFFYCTVGILVVGHTHIAYFVCFPTRFYQCPDILMEYYRLMFNEYKQYVTSRADIYTLLLYFTSKDKQRQQPRHHHMVRPRHYQLTDEQANAIVEKIEDMSFSQSEARSIMQLNTLHFWVKFLSLESLLKLQPHHVHKSVVYFWNCWLLVHAILNASLPIAIYIMNAKSDGHFILTFFCYAYVASFGLLFLFCVVCARDIYRYFWLEFHMPVFFKSARQAQECEVVETVRNELRIIAELSSAFEVLNNIFELPDLAYLTITFLDQPMIPLCSRFEEIQWDQLSKYSQKALKKASSRRVQFASTTSSDGNAV